MTRASDELLLALAALRGAADKELQGEAHTAALQAIRDLLQLAGADGEGLGSLASDTSFGQALAEVRGLAEEDLSGNQFYIVSEKLDALGGLHRGLEAPPSVTAPALEEPVPLLEREPESPPSPFYADPVPQAASGASLNQMSASAKDRVEQMAASFGVASAHLAEQATGTVPQEAFAEQDAFADMEFEKRSSEPCSMPEVVPPDVAIVAPPPMVGTEAASARELAEAAHDLGSPAHEVEAGHILEYAGPHAGAAEAMHLPEAVYAPGSESQRAPHEDVPADAQQIEEHAAPEPEPVQAAHIPEPLAPEPDPHLPEAAYASGSEPQPAPPREVRVPVYAAVQAEPAPVPEHPARQEAPAEAQHIEEHAARKPEPVEAAHAPEPPAPESQPFSAAPVRQYSAHRAEPAGAVHVWEPAARVQPKPERAPAPEAPPAPAATKGPAIEKRSEPKREPQKTLFGLWLDIMFGRKK